MRYQTIVPAVLVMVATIPGLAQAQPPGAPEGLHRQPAGLRGHGWRRRRDHPDRHPAGVHAGRRPRRRRVGIEVRGIPGILTALRRSAGRGRGQFWRSEMDHSLGARAEDP